MIFFEDLPLDKNILHALGKRVVAEGVETKEEFDYLVSIGAFA